MSLSKTFLIVSLLTSGISLGSPAFAGDLEEGMSLYKSKDYTKARPYLEKSAKENPKSWQSHFYLGHTWYALGRLANAKYEYELCKRASNDQAVIQHCNAGIARVDQVASKAKPAAAKPASADSQTSIEDPSQESIEEDTAKVEVEKKRAAIIEKAKKECETIKAEVKKKLTDEKAEADQSARFVDPEMLKTKEEELNKEAEGKCKKIMEEAERTARTYR